MSLLFKSFINKISIFIISILLFSLLINAFLNYFNFEQSYKETRKSNFNIVATDAVATIKSGLDMGLKPAEMKNIKKILDELFNSNNDIKFMAVFNSSHKILYKSGENSSLLDTLTWTGCSNETCESNTAIITLPIENAFLEVAGYFVLKYKVIGQDGSVKKMGNYLTKLLFITILISAIIIFLGVSLIFSDLVLRFKNMNNYITKKEDKNRLIPDEVATFKNSTDSIIDELSKIENSLDK